MINSFLILFGKFVISLSKFFNLGSGSTWPGHIALKLNPNFIRQILDSHPKGVKPKVIIIAGTNGKTTTGKLITEILRSINKSVLHNAAGANLLNGLASTLIKGSSLYSLFSLPRSDPGRLKQSYLVFECDENALPEVIEQTNPDYVICLNLFRDQLDRYGEIDSIAKKWHKSFKKLNTNTTLILNVDDPQISFLSDDSKAKTLHFGLEAKSDGSQIEHGADSAHCPNCGSKLEYESVFFSHLGVWKCSNCQIKRPMLDISNLGFHPLVGTYNKYNTLAAYLFAKHEKIKYSVINEAFRNFTPAFGRQEKINYKGKNVQIFLSKNPTSFNESLQTIKFLGGKNLLFVLNDKIPDGLDVSWIWDVNLEEILEKQMNIAVSGDRVYDMVLRLKYAEQFTHVEQDLKKSINQMVEKLEENETLYILPNYSAMLEVRKVLTGRKIL